MRFLFLTLIVANMGLGLSGMGPEFLKENEELRHTWRGQKQWDGFFCDGGYSYALALQALVDDIDFKLRSETEIEVVAKLTDLVVKAKGRYRSELSACVPVSGAGSARSDWLEIKSLIRGSDADSLSVSIQSTRFAKIELSSWVPSWFEEFFTDLVNRALVEVWDSKLGDWIDRKLGEKLKELVGDEGDR